MDLSGFLNSHGEDEPSGENLEYDPAFISLELAAQPGEERQVGDSVIAAEDPDHDEVLVYAADVLGRSHDLRAAVFLAHSLLRTKGVTPKHPLRYGVRGFVPSEPCDDLRWWQGQGFQDVEPVFSGRRDDGPDVGEDLRPLEGAEGA